MQLQDLIAQSHTKRTERERLYRTERTMFGVRLAGALFAFIHILTFYEPYPAGVQELALGLAFGLMIGNIAIWAINRRIVTTRSARQLSLASLALDIATICGFLFTYAFDPDTAIWALFYIIPLEGAIRFDRGGAFISMSVATLLYVGREWFGHQAYGNPFIIESITFRMGLGYLIAAVAGAMSSSLTKDRDVLEKSNNLHESILETLGHLGEGLVISDGPTILYANPAMEAITGYTRKELMAMNSVIDLVAPDEQVAISQKLQVGVLSSGDLFETAMIHANGQRIELEVAFRPIENSQSNRVVAIVRNITQRKVSEYLLRKGAEQLREAQHIAQVGSWEWDLSQESLVWSEELFRLLGFDPETTRADFDHVIFKIHPDDRAPFIKTLKQAWVSQKPFSIEFRMMKDQSIHDYHCRGEVHTPPGGRHAIKMIGTIQDITDRKRYARLIEAAYEREKEATAKLRDLDSRKTDFLSTVAHELRTPITTVTGFARTLEARWDHVDDEKKQDFIGRISKSSLQLGRLVEELLDFSRLERGKFELVLEECSVKEIILSVQSDMADVLSNHHLLVEIRDDAHVLVDEDSLRRVLENLLTNAAKFAKPGSTINITGKDEREDFVISVQDAGPGIPLEEQARVFDRFYRVNRGNTSPPGTGIGLAIVKELVQAQGGSVWLECPPEGGSVFSVSLKKPSVAYNGSHTVSSFNSRTK